MTIQRTMLGMRIIGILAGLLIIGLMGCSEPLTTREKGTLIGGGLGAGTGALIGSQVGNPGAGAAIGGALGAGAGALTGDQLQKQERRHSEQQYEIEQQRRELEHQRSELEDLERRHGRDGYY
jgi:uncharacterized protein YcfJ